MGFAITHIDDTVLVHENAVRAGQLALVGIAIRTVASLTRSEYRGNDATLEIDTADSVVLGIRNVDAAIL
jgi:hypothetical protein